MTITALKLYNKMFVLTKISSEINWFNSLSKPEGKLPTRTPVPLEVEVGWPTAPEPPTGLLELELVLLDRLEGGERLVKAVQEG